MTHNFEIIQGATFETDIYWEDALTKVKTVFTGMTAKMQLRSSFAAETFAAELSTANSKIIIDGTKMTLKLTDAQSAAIPAGNYVYDLEVSDGTTVTKLLRGAAKVVPEVTR